MDSLHSIHPSEQQAESPVPCSSDRSVQDEPYSEFEGCTKESQKDNESAGNRHLDKQSAAESSLGTNLAVSIPMNSVGQQVKIKKDTYFKETPVSPNVHLFSESNGTGSTSQFDKDSNHSHQASLDRHAESRSLKLACAKGADNSSSSASNKRTRIRKRDVLESCTRGRRPAKYKNWQDQFPWLDTLPSGHYICTICQGANKSNTFAQGTHIKILRSIKLLKHEISKEHMEAKGTSLESTVQEYCNRETKHATSVQGSKTRSRQALIPDKSRKQSHLIEHITEVETSELIGSTLSCDFFKTMDPAVSTIGLSLADTESLVLQRAWFEQYPWLEYCKNDGKYFRCKYCFLQNSKRGQIKLPRTALVSTVLQKHQEQSLHTSAKKKYNLDDKKKSSNSGNKFENNVQEPSNVLSGSPESKVQMVDEREAYWSKMFWQTAKHLRQNGALCDVELCLTGPDGKQNMLSAHKLVLVCASEYFKARLANNALESNIQLDDLDIQIEGLEGVIDYLYGGRFLHVTKEQASLCLHAARELKIPSAIQAFEKFINVIEKEAEAQIKSCDSHCDVENGSPESHDHPNEKNGEPSMKSDESDQDETNKMKAKISNVKQTMAISVNNVKLKQMQNDPPENFTSTKSARKRKQGCTLSSCDICGENFTKKVHLTRHLRKVHKDTLEGQPNKKYVCPTCNKSFARAYKMTEHLRQHTGDRPHLCPKCGKTFTGRDNLLQHIKTHDTEERRRHKCDKCDMAYYNHTALANHKKAKHSGGQRLHVCDYCGKAFAWAQVLKNHVLRHQPPEAKRFKCTQCPWSFYTSDHLKRHMRTHNKAQAKQRTNTKASTKCESPRDLSGFMGSGQPSTKQRLPITNADLDEPQYHSLTSVTNHEGLQLPNTEVTIPVNSVSKVSHVGPAMGAEVLGWQFQYIQGDNDGNVYQT